MWGLRAPAADILGERLNLPPELRACAGLGFGLLHGPGPFAEDPLAQLGTPTLELVSKLASTTLLEKVE